MKCWCISNLYNFNKDDADAEYQEADTKWQEKMQQEQKESEIADVKVEVPTSVIIISPFKEAELNVTPAKPAKNRMSILDSLDDEENGWLYHIALKI